MRKSGRLCAVLLAVSLLALGGLAPAAGAVTATLPVTVNFWQEDSDAAAAVDGSVDQAREALLIRQANGTYTLELPIQRFSLMGMKGSLSGLTIGDISYEGELSGSLDDGSALLTIRNLPASVLTGSNISRALLVSCSIRMELGLLGKMVSTVRLSIAVN